uniref:Uncharacterized protein n=1 Tax=Romanomermis culicivorax TaxID=13658 RepID=A0A915HUA2_ROMCU
NCISNFDNATIAIGKKAVTDDGSSSTSSGYSANNKKKNKVRKDNVCLVDIHYNKPIGGLSSSTIFVGMEDDSENSLSIGNDFPLMNGDGDMFRKSDIPRDIPNSVNEIAQSSAQARADDNSEENVSIGDDPEDQIETEVFLDEIVRLKSQLKLAQKEWKILFEEKEVKFSSDCLEANISAEAGRHFWHYSNPNKIQLWRNISILNTFSQAREKKFKTIE